MYTQTLGCGYLVGLGVGTDLFTHCQTHTPGVGLGFLWVGVWVQPPVPQGYPCWALHMVYYICSTGD